MHVLKKNLKLGIDNENISFKEINQKLTEEFTEVSKAIVNYSYDKTKANLIEIIREVFDLIQICILTLFKCHKISEELEDNDLIQKINIEHKDKLSEKGWIPLTGIEIDVKE